MFGTLKIEDWAIVFVPPHDYYMAPELQKRSLNGRVFGHPKFPNGHWVTTSDIVGVTEYDEILTKSGSTYELGEAREEYEKLFPDAKQRLLDSLRK